MKGKSKIIFHKVANSLFFVFSLAITVFLIVGLCNADYDTEGYYLMWLGLIQIPNIFIFAFWIASLFLSCEEYRYRGNRIIVYAGWFHHYIEINGTIYDEYNSLSNYTGIYLSCLMDDETLVEATISRSNRIALKINGRLRYPYYKGYD